MIQCRQITGGRQERHTFGSKNSQRNVGGERKVAVEG